MFKALAKLLKIITMFFGLLFMTIIITACAAGYISSEHPNQLPDISGVEI